VVLPDKSLILVLLIAVGVVLVETPAAPRSDRFFFHPTGVMSGVEWNGTAARRRCPCST
jgi:hypothetical protein